MAWQDKSFTELEGILKTDISGGLSKKEAKKRLRENGYNNVLGTVRGDFTFYFKKVASNLLCVLMFVSALVSLFFGNVISAAVIILSLLFSVGVAFFTYVKANKVLENVSEYSTPSAKVVREGNLYTVRMNEVVFGDLIYIKKGDIVPADARLVSSKMLKVRETGIAGDGICEKDALASVDGTAMPKNLKNMIFAGTLVTGGEGYALVCETGASTLLRRRTKASGKRVTDNMRLMLMLKRISGIVTLCAICLLATLTAFCLLPIYKGDKFDGYMLALALAIGTMSELYTILGTVILAGGIYGGIKEEKSSNKGGIIKNALCIERLADTDVVIVTPRALYDSEKIRISEISTYDEDIKTESAKDIKGRSDITRVIGYAALIALNTDTQTQKDKVLINFAEKLSLGRKELCQKYKILNSKSAKENAVGDLVLCECVGKPGEKLITAHGKAKDVIAKCAFYRQGGKFLKMDEAARERLCAKAEAKYSSGMSVSAIASMSITPEKVRNRQEMGLVFECFISFELPLCKGCAETFEKLRQSGIQTVIFAESDNTEGIVKALGIPEKSAHVMTSEALKNTKDDMLRVDLELYGVYKELDYGDKKRVIKAMKENGMTVLFLAEKLEDIGLMRVSGVSALQAVNTLRRDTPKNKSKKGVLSNLHAEKDEKNAKDDETPDALRYCADVLVCGGYNALSDCVKRAKGIHLGVFRMLKYLTVTSCIRLVLVLLTLFFGSAFITPLQALVSGLVFDFLSVMTIVFTKPESIGNYRIDTEESKKPEKVFIPCAAQGVALAFVYIALALTLESITRDVIFSDFTFFLTLATLPMILFMTLRQKSVFSGKVYLSRAFVLTILFDTAFIAACFLTKLKGVFGLSFPGLHGLAFAAAANIIVFIVFEAMRKIVESIRR